MELGIGYHTVYGHSITIIDGLISVNATDECGRTFSVIHEGQTVECPDGKCEMYSMTPTEVEVNDAT